METIAGRYRLVRQLGRGGMGVVWAAEDQRLGRTVALKTLLATAGEGDRERLCREARAAAAITHPNICQVHDLAIDGDDQVYVAMELLEGTSLEERLGSGALPTTEAARVAEQVLAALDALHCRGLVHRDLKPSNVFLTPHGVKVLDFGLALPLAESLRLTQPGMVLGTPHYMAPEQWQGEEISAAADLFACGALLFEMLAGQPAFPGRSAVEVCQAVLMRHPPALTGGPRIEAIDRVIHRALAKRPADRWPSATAMAASLVEAATGTQPLEWGATRRLESGGVGTGERARAVTRLLVLPFRMLRPDPEADFLCFALADALTVALGGLPSLVLRSPLAGATLVAAGSPDLPALARDLEVDAVLSGTLLTAAGQVRLSAQLLEAPRGTVLATTTAQASLADVFQLQDTLTHAVLDALRVSLSPQQDQRLQAAAPGNDRSYQLYLRANDVGATIISTSRLLAARDLYRACLEGDPTFAPAWARLGRIHRVLGKYGHGEEDPAHNRRLASEAFERALALAPDLPLAHDLFTYFEIEELRAAPAAIERLLGRVRAGAAGAEVLAGLVVACRFCGLLEASIAAHQEARRRDPQIRTSVHFTHFARGDYEQALAADHDEVSVVRFAALALSGRTGMAIEELRRLRRPDLEGHERRLIEGYLAALEGRSDDARRSMVDVQEEGFNDPEGLFHWGRMLVGGGCTEEGFGLIRAGVEGGYHCPTMLAEDPWLEPLRADPRFGELIDLAHAGREAARRRFADLGGEALLGMV